MNKFKATRNLIRNADHLLIVNDGAFCWVGDRDAIENWFTAHGYTQNNAQFISPDEYQDLCDSTDCESDRVATVGNGDCVRLCNILSERCGVDILYIG